MNVSILASMDALDHGCTRDMKAIFLASMHALDHGYTNDMSVIILANVDALDHGCTEDMYASWPAWTLCVRTQLLKSLPSVLRLQPSLATPPGDFGFALGTHVAGGCTSRRIRTAATRLAL